MFSVVIPAYNQARFLGDAIDSVLSQTYSDHEIIVVDDGSTDNTLEVVASYGSQVRYIYQENKGLGGARNIGIKAAHNDIVGLLDADDKWMPNYLDRMSEMVIDNPLAAVYYCSARGIDENNFELPQLFGGPPVPPDLLYETLLRTNFIIPSTIIFRKQVLLREGLFDQNNKLIHGCEDWDLWLRIAPNYQIIGTADCLVHYRIHDTSLSADSSRMQNAIRAVIEKQFGIDDGNPEVWSDEKRRAYGGGYRYHLIASIQKQNGWVMAPKYLQQCLFVDHSLSLDLDLFYELALGSQPTGFRGTPKHLCIKENANHLNKILWDVFDSPRFSNNEDLKRSTFGTMNFALALIAFNTGKRSLSRRFLLTALKYRPGLWRDSRSAGNLLKSFFSESITCKIKSIVNAF